MLHRQSVRWVLALGYTIFLVAYLLQQPGAPAVEIVAPVAAPDWRREVVFTIGHIIGFGTLFLLWYLPLARTVGSTGRAVVYAVAIAVAVGSVAEGLQSLLPERSASLYDMTMNLIGIGLAWGMLRTQANS